MPQIASISADIIVRGMTYASLLRYHPLRDFCCFSCFSMPAEHQQVLVAINIYVRTPLVHSRNLVDCTELLWD